MLQKFNIRKIYKDYYITIAETILELYTISLTKNALFYYIGNYRPKKALEDMMEDAPKDAIDLCKKLLHFNPDKRITADEALRHPYVQRFHNPKEEISLNYDVVPPLSDDVQLTVDEYRTKLYEVLYSK